MVPLITLIPSGFRNLFSIGLRTYWIKRKCDPNMCECIKSSEVCFEELVTLQLASLHWNCTVTTYVAILMIHSILNLVILAVISSSVSLVLNYIPCLLLSLHHLCRTQFCIFTLKVLKFKTLFIFPSCWFVFCVCLPVFVYSLSFIGFPCY